jgi:putative endonuclease
MAFKLQNELGVWGEQTAEAAYLKQGFILVARNVCNSRGKRLGEIDLVMRSDRSLIFVEVKVRRGNKFGTALESITKHKRRRLIKIVHWFRQCFPAYGDLRPRIDVCAITLPSTSHLDKQAINVIIIPDAVTLDY